MAGHVLQESAPAKINLALHVRARRADGYHDIETVFAFAEQGDLLTVEQGEGLGLEVRGPFADELDPNGSHDSNLVLRAAEALRARCGIKEGARLRLDKRLPVAAGLGGGSADAAAALRLLSLWWGPAVDERALWEIAETLGADVPACLYGRPARGEGRGDDLQPIDDTGLSGMPLLLVNPCVPLSTAAVFAAWDGTDRGPLTDWRRGRNDLEPAATKLVPEIAEVLSVLEDARFARMSGSGATCFGLYDDEGARDADAAAIANAHPGWWVLATRLQ